MNAPAPGPGPAPARAEVQAAQSGFRADRALVALAPSLSRRAAKLLFHEGRIRHNGRVARGSESVRPGDMLEYPDPTTAEGAASLARAQAPRLTTRHGRQVARLHEDEWVLILCKPTEIPVHPGQDDHSRRETLQDVLERAYPGVGGVGGVAGPEVEDGPAADRAAPPAGAGRAGSSLYFVHRLDMETSGCLVVAKGQAARDALIGAFQSREVEKQYWAVAVGEVPWDRRVVRKRIAYVKAENPASADQRRGRPEGAPEWVQRKRFKRAPRNVKMAVVYDESSTQGKEAETTFIVEERFRGYTLLRCEPRTGRTHQIRVHLQSEGFPLAYDALYGRRSPLRLREFYHPAAATEEGERVLLNRLPLHAWRIAFRHPVTGERIAAEAPLPGDLREFLRMLRKYRARKEIQAPPAWPKAAGAARSRHSGRKGS